MVIAVGANRPFFQSGKNPPEVIAHRGGGGEYPEETIFAFEQAIKIGSDVLEMDLHRTADGELVLMHNSTVDETTDGTGQIKDLTLSEIKKLNAASEWKGYEKLEVPTIDEVFQTFPNTRMNIEIKPKDPSLIAYFCHLIGKYNMTDKVLVACGWNSTLHEFRRQCPDVATSASVLEVEEFETLDKILDWDYRPDTDAIQWHTKLIIPILTKRFVDKAHSLNLRVHAWTINDPSEMRKMVDLGVDGIITDYPSTLLKVLGRT